MIDEISIKNFITGMLLSVASWEVWENIIVTLAVALIGGFLAAAGRQLHKNLYEWHKNRKLRKK